ncbi:uncharacterized protein LOC114524927 [Dendronephthya gigantea]|uniref:uncharacterized protein LOC114524927 n=1 Tax=Dendronephthya gigantea TaxID=151771 RepID=UPI00106D42A7|nr:uncharacterized protein LOC114524927 [Dendronephthya gigantea]
MYMAAWILNFTLYCIYIQCSVVKSVFCDEWSYGNTKRWKELWKDCGGKHQSPVNIIDAEAVTLRKRIALTFNNFSTSLSASLVNNGKTAKLTLLSKSKLSVSGNRLYIKSLYTLDEVHFHWNDNLHSGSEHKIDGKSSSLEVHMVHYKMDYASFKTARTKPDGVLVLSILVDVSTNVSQNSFWKEITDGVTMVMDPGSKTQLQNVRFSDFLPRNTDDFYFYKGSFTTPPCFETVTWILFKEKLLIPEEYLQKFWDLKTNGSAGQELLTSNIRPVRPLNSRTVLKTFQSHAGEDEKKHVYEKVVNGVEVIGILQFYQCNVPFSVSLSVIIPSSDVSWRSENITLDIQWPGLLLDAAKSYRITLEMHDHPEGKYRNNVHLDVQLNGVKIINSYYHLSKSCLQDSCSWAPVGKSKTCTRRLIDTDEELQFTLTRQQQCRNVYSITIKKYDSVVFKTEMKPKTRVKVKPHAVDQRLNEIFSRWYFILDEAYANDSTIHAMLSVDLPNSILSRKGILVEGVYQNGANCESGTPSHIKLIVGIAVGLFIIIAVIVLTLYLAFKNIIKSSKPNMLVQEDELDTAV